MSARIEVRLKDWSKIDRKLAELPIAMRGNELARGLRAVGSKIVQRAKREVQQTGKPGYHEFTGGKRPRRKQGKPMLKDTIGHQLRQYSYAFVLVVGPEYPAGAHGHLVESGHRIAKGGTLMPESRKKKSAPRSNRGRTGLGTVGGMARPHPFMQPSVPSESEVEAAIINSLDKAVNRVLRG